MHDFFSFILCISIGVDTSILKGEERGGGEKEKDDKWGKWEASTGMFLRSCVGNPSSIHGQRAGLRHRWASAVCTSQ